jgi:hypothetical protein
MATDTHIHLQNASNPDQRTLANLDRCIGASDAVANSYRISYIEKRMRDAQNGAMGRNGDVIVYHHTSGNHNVYILLDRNIVADDQLWRRFWIQDNGFNSSSITDENSIPDGNVL